MPSLLNPQSYELPDSRKAGESGIYRNAKQPVVVETFSPKVRTMYDLFAHGRKISRDRPCVGHRKVESDGKRGPYVWETYNQVARRITHFGSGLLNLLNHTLGDARTQQIPIGIWSVNRPEWLVADLACAAYGLYTIALYDTLGPDTAEFIINHAEIETVVCSGDHVADLLKMKDKLPRLKAIISMDALPTQAKSVVQAWATEKGVILQDFATIEQSGKANTRTHNPPQPDDLAFIMYTSGTTGTPKGAMLTHRNFIAAASATYSTFRVHTSDITISYLPLAHIFGRINEAAGYLTGSQIGYYSGVMDNLVDDIQVLRPTIFATVPRLLNRIYSKINQTFQEPGAKGALARHALSVKLANLNEGKGFTHPLWDRLVFSKVRQALGGRVRFMVTGSAPIAPEVLQFLRVAFCCDIREGYGATETAAVLTVQAENEHRAGHVGGPFNCNEVKLVDVPEMNYRATDPNPRGEICVRGPNVFIGYFKNEAGTREALDADGWYHTGDIGLVDAQGALQVIDRKKNIFKLAQGEYIAPEKIENVYAKVPIVAQLFVHGDSLQSSLVAILVPDPDALRAFAAQMPDVQADDLSALCRHPKIKTAVLQQLTVVGKKASLKGFELVKAVHLEPEPFSVENDLLTPTFKVKRALAAERYKAEITEMYNSMPSEKAKL